jgi:Xaa-Pro aminopeptidase
VNVNEILSNSEDKQLDLTDLEDATADPVKSPEVLLGVVEAAALGDLCFDYILTKIKVGISEIEIAELIDGFFMSHGAEGLAFPTIVVSGARGALIHGEPSAKLVESGDFITMDFGARYSGACGDMTRTVAVGSVSEKQREVYDIVLRAQLAGIAAVKAGVRCGDVDKVVRDIITDAGYGEYYIHSTGHGIGRIVHEPPFMKAGVPDILPENSAVSVEPGIYIPDELGVRIEDLVIVTNFGAVNIVRSNKSLIIL